MLKKRPSTHFVTAHSCAQRWPRRTSLPSVFTVFVRSLQGERTPDADLFHDAWHGLRAALAGEMKKRGLWQSPPSYLGAHGWESWSAETPQGALAELVADCYAFVFVDRLQSLKRHLEEKSDIEGLVLLNIRHFLHERQREHDPLGFRVFEMLQTAVEEAVASGALHVLAGDKKIRNDTRLGFDPAAEPPLSPPDLEPVVLRWNDELMPSLLTANNRQHGAVVQQLRARLLELPRYGVEAFRFKDLLDPLKRDARRRWAALLTEEDDGPVTLSSQVPVESRQSFEHLTRCVSTSIDRLEADARTRSQLTTLWHYLHRQSEEHLPSYRRLGQLLSIPRERLPVLFTLLRHLVPRPR